MNDPEVFARGIPPVVALLLAGLGGLVAAWLYWPEVVRQPRRVGHALVGLRVAVVVILVFLLADIARRETVHRDVRPELLLLIDGSGSMGLEDPLRPADQIAAEEKTLGNVSAQKLRSMTRLEVVTEILGSSDTVDGESLLDALERRFQVIPLLLGESAAALRRQDDGRLSLPSPADSHTDLGRPVLDAVMRRDRANIGAVVLVSDGGHNAGARPEEVLASLKAMGLPLFTLGVGSRTPPPDVAITRLEGPDMVYRGDTPGLAVTIRAAGFGALELPVRIEDGESLVGEYTVEVPASQETSVEIVVPLDLSLPVGGRRKLTISLPPREGEATTANNLRDFWVDVLQEKIRVLFLDGGPRWEYRYLRNTLENDPNITASTYLVTRPPDRRLPPGFPRQRNDLFAHDVVVLGDVESTVFTDEELDALRDLVATRGGTLVLIAGDRGMPYSYTGTVLAELLPVKISSSPVARRDAAVGGGGFSLALTPAGERSPISRIEPNRERNRELWSLLPALYWYSPHDGATTGAEVLATVSSGSAEIASPDSGQKNAVLLTREVGAGKVFFTTVDDTWRWRFRVGEEFFSKYWQGVIRWAASGRLPAGDDTVRIGTDRARHDVSGVISVRALVRAADGQPLHGPDARVDVEITNENTGVVHRRRLQPIPGSGGLFRGKVPARADQGGLGPGEYRAVVVSPALPEYGRRTDRATARFAVTSPPSREPETTARDGTLLATLASTAAPGGRYLPIERARELVGLLPETTINVEETVVVDQWTFTWPLITIIGAFLSAEWILRRRYDLV